MYPGLHIFFLLIQVNEKDAGTIELCLRATSTCLKAAVGDAVFGAPSEWTMTSQHSKRKDPTVTTFTSKDSGRFGRDLTMTFEKATTDDRTSVGRCEIRPLSRPDGFGTFSNEIRFAPRGDACEGGEKVEGLGNLRFETGIANNWELAAKIVGSGGGGCMVAMIKSANIQSIKNAFLKAGAKNVFEVKLINSYT